MASSGASYLKDIDEKFCQCPICLQQYREPKQLPCLHRYCTDCLKQLIEKNKETAVATCPECRDEFTIPTEGVDGFKTDFYMKNIIEYIQIQKSLEDEKLQECYNCSQKLNVTAYCFKCNGFLCNQCHEIHMGSKSLKDHMQHALSLEDLKSKHMTLEKLADLREAPRCESHPQDLCRLCCKTCDNLPICVTCTYGSHKNHDINDVGIIASEERQTLKHELKNVSQNKERILKMPQTVDRVKDELISTIQEKKEKFTIHYEENIELVKKEIEKIEEDCKLCQIEIEEETKTKLMESRKLMAKEMKQVKMKYDNIFDEIKEIGRVKLVTLKQKQEEDLQERRENIAILEKQFKTLIKTLETRQEEGLKKLHEIPQQMNDVIERYENLITTGYSVLETRNDWTAVQCIPDICKAIEPLSKNPNKEFSELETLSRIGVSPEITAYEDSPVNVDEFQTNDCRIDSITGSGNGNIVITGRTSTDYLSHITVINTRGKLVHQRKLKSTFIWPFRFCASLSEFKIATTCWPDEIGVFDMRGHSYIKKNISDVINSWPVGRNITAMTTDPVNNHILVGGYDSRDLYVFDDQLNYHHTLTLPETINYPYDITASEGNLLVCDRDGKKAYVVHKQDLGGKVIRAFQKPDSDGDNWNPMNVCTDINGFIYILWMTDYDFTSGRRVVTQHTQDDGRLLTAEHLDVHDARCMAVVKTGMTEKLLVATWGTGKLYIYNIW